MNNLECPKPTRLLDNGIQLSDTDMELHIDDIPVTNTPFCGKQDTVHNSGQLRYAPEELFHTVLQYIIHHDKRSIETEVHCHMFTSGDNNDIGRVKSVDFGQIPN
jgi:hypothetical protein